MKTRIYAAPAVKGLRGDFTGLATIWRHWRICYICEIPKSSPNSSQVFPNVYLSFAKCCLCSQNGLPIFCDDQNPCDYWDTNICCFPQIFTKLFAGLAICSPNSSQAVSDSLIDSHAGQFVAKCLPNDLNWTIPFSTIWWQKSYGDGKVIVFQIVWQTFCRLIGERGK